MMGRWEWDFQTKSPYNRLYGKVQFFPWMEAVVRYTEGTMYPYNPGSGQTWKDKGIDVKFRLVQEGRLMPELALGFNDLGGTGAFSSEFIAASKRFENIDLTLGLGWGRLGSVDHLDNPFDRVLRGGFGGGSLGGAFNFLKLFLWRNDVCLWRYRILYPHTQAVSKAGVRHKPI